MVVGLEHPADVLGDRDYVVELFGAPLAPDPVFAVGPPDPTVTPVPGEARPPKSRPGSPWDLGPGVQSQKKPPGGIYNRPEV